MDTTVKNINVDNIIEDLPKFSGDENYWIISSGKEKELYDYFYKYNFIGLAWNKIKINDVKDKSLEDIKTLVRDKYHEIKKTYSSDSGFSRAVTIFSKELDFFVNTMKEGDIVIVKDRSRNRLMFGKVISDIEEAEEHEENLFIDNTRGNCNKIRRIEWLRLRDKNIVSDRIQNRIRVQQAIVKINDDYLVNDINKTIFSLFTRKGQVHAVFNVKKQEDIIFENYYNFLGLIHKFKQDNNFTDEFYIKSNVSSPGPIEIFGKPEEIMALLGSFGVIKGLIKGLKPKSLEKEYSKSEKDLELLNPGTYDEGFDEGSG